MESDVRSAISEVRVTERDVRVSFRVGDSDDRIKVATHRSIDDMKFHEVEITWSGTGDRDIEYAEQFQSALHEAIQVAKRMQLVLLEHDRWSEHLIDTAADYSVALYALVKGGTPFYLRGRTAPVPNDPQSRVVDLEGLRKLAKEVSA